MPIINLAIILIFVIAAAYRPPEKSFLSRRWFAFLLPILASAAFIFSFFRDSTPGSFTYDDSYISLSAARNIAEHFEMAVIRGRPLQGITSPLHVLLTGIIGTVTGVEIAARLVSLLAFFAAVFGCGLYAERFTGDRRAFFLASALCLLSGPMLYDIGNGMETSLFTALVIWSFYLAQFAAADLRGVILTGVVVGLTMLTRPEGHFVAASAIGVPALKSILRADWRGLGAKAASGGIAFAVFSPFLAANLHYTGHFFSATVSAKSIFFMGGHWFTPSFKNLKLPFALFLPGSAEIIALVAVIGLLWNLRFAEVAFPIAFYLAYLYRFPDALNHYRARYQHPLWPLVALGATLLVYWFAKKASMVKIVRWAFPGAFAAVLIFSAVSGSPWYKMAFEQDTYFSTTFLRPMVMAVNNYSKEGDLVAAHDVGALAYFSTRRILDMVGLTDERIARRLATQRRRPFDEIARIIADQKPPIVVVIRDWEDNFLHLQRRTMPGIYKLLWSSAPNGATHAIYDVYECQWP